MPRSFYDLSEKEILALAISLEEEDGRIYGEFAERMRAKYPKTATLLDAMREEESGHRHRLTETYREKFGEYIPLLRRQDVKGFVNRKPIWLNHILTAQQVRSEVGSMEQESRRYYQRAAQKSTVTGVRELLSDLAEEESKHVKLAEELETQQVESGERKEEEDAARRTFVLQVVQPGLAGLMDGSVSTLAPVFAAAFATRNSWDAFLVGLAASLGAGISMGFAEALSDDGTLTGRGHPWVRGFVCGLMTALGGIGHTLPFLIPAFTAALTAAMAVVVVELGIITWVRAKYMDTRPLTAALQVGLGGALVFGTGVLIGSS